MLAIASASRHAVDRYRIHYPDAVPADVLTAAHAAIPIDRSLALALAGRVIRDDPASADRHLLHPEGTGMFVLLPVATDPSRWFVKTYLRFVTAEQRRMVREWFLDPLPLLRRAFELGFDAARAPDAPALALQASRDHVDALLALAPRLAVTATDAEVSVSRPADDHADVPLAAAPPVARPPPRVAWATPEGWTVCGWSATARHEAEALGIRIVPASRLSTLEPVPADALAAKVTAAGWLLASGATYAGLRLDDVVLLLRQKVPGAPATVARCGRLGAPS